MINKSPFDVASEQCVQEGGYLATISNDEEQQFLDDVWHGMDLQETPNAW